MNELLNQFEKETGNRVDFCGPKIYRDKYVEWLEAKVAQKPEVSENDVKRHVYRMLFKTRLFDISDCAKAGQIIAEGLKAEGFKLF